MAQDDEVIMKQLRSIEDIRIPLKFYRSPIQTSEFATQFIKQRQKEKEENDDLQRKSDIISKFN